MQQNDSLADGYSHLLHCFSRSAGGSSDEWFGGRFIFDEAAPRTSRVREPLTRLSFCCTPLYL